MDCVRLYDSPLGPITLAADGRALTGLWFEGQAHFGAGLSRSGAERRGPALDEACRWLDAFFSGHDPGFTPLLAPRGTPFQRAVWELLASVPWGKTVSYGGLAARLAAGKGISASPRAVGGAVARNPISLIVPCHRVVGADGRLTGYAGGLWRKEKLLALERGGAQLVEELGRGLERA